MSFCGYFTLLQVKWLKVRFKKSINGERYSQLKKHILLNWFLIKVPPSFFFVAVSYSNVFHLCIWLRLIIFNYRNYFSIFCRCLLFRNTFIWYRLELLWGTLLSCWLENRMANRCTFEIHYSFPKWLAKFKRIFCNIRLMLKVVTELRFIEESLYFEECWVCLNFAGILPRIRLYLKMFGVRWLF